MFNELKILIVPTPFSTVPRNKVVALQIVNKHLTFYGNKRLIAVFIRNRPPLVPILRQMKPVYTIALKCFKWSATSRALYQEFVLISLLFLRAACPVNLMLLYMIT